jgi:flagellar biosynthesis/type III secretory pathway M-ring protein FliF/YscJ
MSFPYWSEFDSSNAVDPSNPIGSLKSVLTEQQGNDSFREQILKVFGFNFGEQGNWVVPDTFFSYIQSILNIALGLLSFICLIILIYNFFIIFFDKEKEGIENAQKTVKRVIYVLLIIWFSWLIVSFIFRAIGQFVN